MHHRSICIQVFFGLAFLYIDGTGSCWFRLSLNDSLVDGFNLGLHQLIDLRRLFQVAATLPRRTQQFEASFQGFDPGMQAS